MWIKHMEPISQGGSHFFLQFRKWDKASHITGSLSHLGASGQLMLSHKKHEYPWF